MVKIEKKRERKKNEKLKINSNNKKNGSINKLPNVSTTKKKKYRTLFINNQKIIKKQKTFV